jgi:2-polyprenyl-3-methyl-5-hydroxy-6-metoxy-1,4-benzoquinol methylase
VICGHAASSSAVERADVHSNVRAFRQELFSLWRCPGCASIHARDEVDLAHYYQAYAFHDLTVDWKLRVLYDNQIRRLARAGLRPGQTVLDYGCGGGHFVAHLNARGFRAVGFDEYTERFADPSVLEQRYDLVHAQDVLEHVTEPNALLDRFDDLVAPGGVIAIGTPNASGIDLTRASAFEQPLHQPYHRHIFSTPALLSAAAQRGWKLLEHYRTMYANTPFPFLNVSFFSYYAGLLDNTLDCLAEPTRAGPLLQRLPVSLYWGLFGYFLAPDTDLMATFRRP